MTNAVAFNRALADPTRWRIVRLVSEHALCVCELADILGMPQSSVSSHVQVIRKASLLDSEKCEKWTYFRVKPEYVTLIGTIQSFFANSEDSEATADLQRTVLRLKKRNGNCCPGPEKLKSTLLKLNQSIS